MDKLGPIKLHYNPRNFVKFNAVETVQIEKVLSDFLLPNPETSILHLGCGNGVISNMLATVSYNNY